MGSIPTWETSVPDTPDPNGPEPTPIEDAPAPPDAPEKGFPENTPIVEMTDAERANYFKFHDRRKSDRLKAYGDITPEQALQWKQEVDEARRNSLQPSERALEDARNEAAAAARAQAETEWAGLMTETVIEQFVTDPQQRQVVLAGLNPAQFMTEGKFDKNKLIGHMTGLAAAFGAGAGTPPRQWGQNGVETPPVRPGAAGLAEAQRRQGITPT